MREKKKKKKKNKRLITNNRDSFSVSFWKKEGRAHSLWMMVESSTPWPRGTWKMIETLMFLPRVDG